MTIDPESQGTQVYRRGTILIVDDDHEFREALAESVRRDGFEVETAKTGLDALERLRWGLRPSVILLDMQMGKMTGWDFRAEQMRDRALAAIPVIAMTAGAWKQRDLGDYAARIAKPVDLADLRAKLDRYRLPAGKPGEPREIGGPGT